MAFCAWCGNSVPQVSYAACPRCGNPSNGAPRPGGTRAGGGGTNPAVVVLAVLAVGLVVVAIVGILAAIAIPNLLTALQRSRQKRSMADMRTLATTIEAYAAENNGRCPQVGDVTQLAPLLTPRYAAQLPTYDGWGTRFWYECRPSGYVLASAGADKQFEQRALEGYAPDTRTTSFDADIIYSNGSFLQYPEGVQREGR